MNETTAARAIDSIEVLRGLTQSTRAQTGKHDIYAAMIAFAAACLERDMTQTAADTLAFLLQEQDLSATLRDEAADIFAELEGRICPRVILDARTFAADMDLLTMLEFLLDVISPETT